MENVTDVRDGGSQDPPARDRAAALPIDETRLAMMRRVRRLTVAERIALLDQICREGTRIATGARRVR